MRRLSRITISVLLAALCAGGAGAQGAAEERVPAPGASLAAAFANIVFFPVRLGITIIGAELGGFTGLMTAGDEEAAEDVWHLFRGQNVLTPEIMQGDEALRFGDFEFRSR